MCAVASPAGPSSNLPQQYHPEKGLKLPTRNCGRQNMKGMSSAKYKL